MIEISIDRQFIQEGWPRVLTVMTREDGDEVTILQTPLDGLTGETTLERFADNLEAAAAALRKWARSE